MTTVGHRINSIDLDDIDFLCSLQVMKRVYSRLMLKTVRTTPVRSV